MGVHLFLVISVLVAWDSVFADLKSHLQQVIQTEVAKECSSCRVDLTIHNEALLNDIAKPDRVIAEHWKGQTNLVLRLGDENRLITTTIRWKDNVVVAKNNIKQGDIIDLQDVRVVEKDVTFLKTPYLPKVEGAIGLTSGRVFQRGHVIDESYLKKPLVVRYGQPIRLVLDQGTMTLSMMGQAKGAGAIGDRIPVYIPDTRKKLFAKIVDKSTARVE